MSLAVGRPGAIRSAPDCPVAPNRRSRSGGASRETRKPGVRIARTPVRRSRFRTRRLSGAAAARLKVVADLPYFDRRAGIFKLFFDFCRLFLVDAFLDRLRRRFDEVFGFLEAELVIARTSLITLTFFSPIAARIDVELGLFGRRLGRAAPPPPAAADRDRRGGRDAPFLFEQSSPDPPLRSRSAPTDRRRALPDQPCSALPITRLKVDSESS